jgi:hypothetical protein
VLAGIAFGVYLAVDQALFIDVLPTRTPPVVTSGWRPSAQNSDRPSARSWPAS